MAHSPQYSYVFPPLILPIFWVFAQLDFITAFHLFLFSKFGLLLGLIELWKRQFLKKEAQEKAGVSFYLFLLFAFGSTLYMDVKAGNISIWEQLVIWSAFYFLMCRQLLVFCLFIILTSIFKVTPLLFLFVLLFTHEKKAAIYFLGACLAGVFILLLSLILHPFKFGYFLQNASSTIGERGPSNPSTFAFLKDCFHWLALRANITLPESVQVTIFAAIAALVLVLTWRAHRILHHTAASEGEYLKITIFLFCLVYALLIPRFMIYSYSLLIPPTYFILRRTAIRQNRPSGSAALALLILLPFSVQAYIALPAIAIDILGCLLPYQPLVAAYGVWGLYLCDIYGSMKYKASSVETSRTSIQITEPQVT